MRKIVSLFAIAALAGSTVAAANPTGSDNPALAWNVDASHTRIGFSVKHFFTPVAGQFDEFEANVQFDPANLAESMVEVRIPVASIDTSNDRRDAHLMSGDFFDAETYPYITFTSTEVRQVGENQFVAVGDLTIKETTRRIELPLTLEGVKQLPPEMSEMFGGIQEVASFTGSYALNRNDFGVGTGSWAATAVVGDEVTIDLQVEVNR